MILPTEDSEKDNVKDQSNLQEYKTATAKSKITGKWPDTIEILCSQIFLRNPNKYIEHHIIS